MNKLTLVLIAAPLWAGSLPVDGNATRQCPPNSAMLTPIAVLDKAAPQNDYCFSAMPPLVGYLEPYKTQRDVVWAPFLIEYPPSDAVSLPVVVKLPPSGPPIPLGIPVQHLTPPSAPPSCDTPEPASWMLAGFGLVGVGSVRRLRRAWAAYWAWVDRVIG